MTCVNCNEVRVVYDGNGIQKFYSFPFPYYDQSEVNVSLYDADTKTWEDMPRDEWSFSNPTTIEFVTEPTEKFKIYRCTPVNPKRAVFHPGHPIRAQDLNDNFEQLGSAIEDSHCYLIDYIDNKAFDLAVINSDDESSGRWDSLFNDDEHLVSALAAVQRFDTAVSENSPVPNTWIQPGKLWVNTDTQKVYYWTGSQWVQPIAGGSGGGGGGPNATAYVGANPPLNPKQGDLWWSTIEANLFIYYVDANSSQWVDASPKEEHKVTTIQTNNPITSSLDSSTQTYTLNFEINSLNYAPSTRRLRR